MHIRLAAETDAALLVDIIRRGFRDVAVKLNLTEENCPTHPSFYTLERLGKDLNKGISYRIAEEEDGRALGCVALERANPGTFYLERLAVIPEARRCGIGKALVERALCEAAAQGGKVVSIAVVARQADLIKWYEGLGFHPVETKHYAHLPFDVAFMGQELKQYNEA